MVPAIHVENLSKQYQIGASERAYSTFREALSGMLAAPLRNLRRLTGSVAESERFWALQDVSFEIQPGEVLGIIGRNGAGKSTLLKILSRITEPTAGRVELNGRVASLLEVGTGFHPELTGRENIFLNGAILGMTRAEIKRKFDEIVAFAEIDRFLDTPVKRYSSGMHVRLAFAVAAHLEPEILVIDEVLAVGDAEFQKKCLGKMEHVARGDGRTVLFVSHNMAAIESLCSSALLLVNGQLRTHGQTVAVVSDYLNQSNGEAVTPLVHRHDRQGSGAVRCIRVSLADEKGESVSALRCGASGQLILEFENRAGRALKKFRLTIAIDSDFGQRVLLLDSAFVDQNLDHVPLGVTVVRIGLPRLCLLPGRYHFTICATLNGIISDWIKRAGFFDVECGDYFGTGQLPPQGVFVADHGFVYESTRTPKLNPVMS